MIQKQWTSTCNKGKNKTKQNKTRHCSYTVDIISKLIIYLNVKMQNYGTPRI